MARRIPLTRGLFAIVDDDDFDRVSAVEWHARPQHKKRPGYYAVNGRGGAKPTTYGCRYLHRFVMNAPDGVLVDHVNGNGLDCRKANLRLATHRQNVVNRKSSPSSGFRGVYREKQKWTAQISIRGKTRRLGVYADAAAAARAYDAAAVVEYGEFAQLNFRDDDHKRRPHPSVEAVS